MVYLRISGLIIIFCINFMFNTSLHFSTEFKALSILWSPDPSHYFTSDMQQKSLSRHTGKFLAVLTLDVIQETRNDKILAIITDSTTLMILIQEQFPHISVYSCGDYCLNLFIEDTTKLKIFDRTINPLLTEYKSK